MVFQHSILAFDDTIESDVYPKIYSHINHFLSSKAGRGAVIYSLEPNPQDILLQKMTDNGIANATYYIQHSALTIFDRDLFYLPTDVHYSQTLASKLSSTVIQLHDAYGYDNFLLFCRAENLSEQGDFSLNMVFEQHLNSHFNSNISKPGNNVTQKTAKRDNLSIEAICLYKKKLLEARALNELIKLVRYHDKALQHQKMSHKTLAVHKIIESIRRGFEEILGEGSSRLLFATLKLIYKIDEERIMYDPDAFFEKLNKMIGRNAASIVIPRISQHIISELLY